MEFGYGLRINEKEGASFGQNLSFSSNTQEEAKKLQCMSTEDKSE